MNPQRYTRTAVGLLLALSLGATAVPDEETEDWRYDLLREEGNDLSREALERMAKASAPASAQLEQAYRKLGAEEFAAREAAQKELLRGGAATFKWLNGLARSPDPEVRRRTEEILRSLSAVHRRDRDAALQHAASSLLLEEGQPRADTGGLFYEWFGEDCAKLDQRYRLLTFENTAERGGSIAEGLLSFPGGGGVDGDQRMVLKATAWPGREEFGEEFEVTARLGGDGEIPGAWHLGIAIGNVRALYHPGMLGGAFRFEQVDDNNDLTDNSGVGFNPSSEHLQWMSIKVRRLAEGRVRLDVTLKEGEEKEGRFEKSLTVKADQIGKLNRIGLARSGRSGGQAHFEELTVRIIR